MSIFRYLYLAKLYIGNLKYTPSKLIESKTPLSLYETKNGDHYWLDKDRYQDKCIIEKGVFEENTTKFIRRKVKNGFVVLDIGANIGYYSVILGGLVGVSGKCYCFEPAKEYRETLQKNLKENSLNNVKVYSFGLSNVKNTLRMNIGTGSATAHWVGDKKPTKTTSVEVITLDSFVKKEGIKKIDFIKMDVDGHEPYILKGGRKFLSENNPIILLEVNYKNYKKAKVNLKDFYNNLKKDDYKIFFDFAPNKEIKTYKQFIEMYGDKKYSQNIIIYK